MEFDPKILGQTGLTQGEFAKLVGTSRVTVWKWITGQASPSVHLKKPIARTMTLLTAAVRLELLPGDLPPASRGNTTARWDLVMQAVGKAKAAMVARASR